MIPNLLPSNPSARAPTASRGRELALRGAHNSANLFFNGDPKAVFTSAVTQFNTPRAPNPGRLLCGYTAGVIWSSVVDAIWFSGQGHQVHWW